MLEIDFVKGEWQKPQISEFKNLSINPLNATIHYAVALFEGMKAFKTEENKVNLFRPNENMIRMNNSAKRITLPVSKILNNNF